MSDNIEKIPSERSLSAQFWIGILLCLPAALAALTTLISWGTLLGNELFPKYFQSVPQGRHDVLNLALWTLPGVILFVILWRLLNRAIKLQEYYYDTLVSGTVADLQPTEYRSYAIIAGVNRVGQQLVRKVPVPIEKVPTLQLGDPYPWQ